MWTTTRLRDRLTPLLPALFMKLLLQARIWGCEGLSRRSAPQHTARVCFRLPASEYSSRFASARFRDEPSLTMRATLLHSLTSLPPSHSIESCHASKCEKP